MKKPWWRFLAVDLRVLACTRICLGLLICLDILARSCDLTAHYTDAGVLPRRVLMDTTWASWGPSFHLFSGYWEGQALFFAFHFILGFLLMVGWHTRWVTFANWIMLISLHLRNPIVLQAADDLLRMMLFWGLFLPLGACWSWDCPERPKYKEGYICSNAGTLAWYLQLLFLYWGSVYSKYGDTWVKDYSATYLALQLDALVLPWGIWLRQYYNVTQFFTFLVYWAEWLLPAILILAVDYVYIRTFCVLGLMLMHICFAQCLMLGLFPWIDATLLVFFMPGFWLDTSWGRHCEAYILWVLRGIKSWFTPKLQAMGQEVRPWIKAWGMGCEWTLVGLTLGLSLAYLQVNLGRGAWELWPISLQFTRNLLISQNWSVFSPNPSTNNGWFVFEGFLHNGSLVNASDLSTDVVVDFSKPALLTQRYGNQRWGKFFLNLAEESHQVYVQHYANYLCSKYNSKISDTTEKIRSITGYFMEETTQPYSIEKREDAPVGKKIIIQHICSS
jgi:hypothetical protein